MTYPQAIELKTGDYLYQAGTDTDDNRELGKKLMRDNGCKSIRYELRETEHSTQLMVHGYLATIEGPHTQSVL